jgi:hypothetical protein
MAKKQSVTEIEDSMSASIVSNATKTKGKRGRKLTEEEKYRNDSELKIENLQ